MKPNVRLLFGLIGAVIFCIWVLLVAVSASAAPQGAPGSITVGPAIPHEPPIKVFDSPDGALVVWATEGHGGVVISVQDKNKQELGSEEHYPEDRPGGFWFKQGGWTPDSKFFVYSTSAWRDGGGNPSDMPIYVYSRAKNAFFDLGKDIAKHVGMTKPGKFSLSFPDVVELEVINSKARSDMMLDVHLAQALADEKSISKVSQP